MSITMVYNNVYQTTKYVQLRQGPQSIKYIKITDSQIELRPAVIEM